ncbi:ARM repeat-containing protein [Calocera viscosa TUFC12733]|uniref:ARM repeat-containing protein n=1 Tax=Calocera viscosa (strain TUFC12733) TaxID=1330018 RepID=A0A167QK92_CALVF|nr:ARM repeat-containing protein [Calocera viscosa TUFC12733]
MDTLLAHVNVSPGSAPPPQLPRFEPMEVSGTPDLQQHLYQVLSDACSQDPARMMPAAQQLPRLEKEPGAFHAIYQIGAEKSVPVPVREMAMIRLKNEMTTHWRSRVLLTEHQKTECRQLSLTFMDEPIDSIFNLNMIVLTKIARFDYPARWENLVPNLLQLIRNSASARLASGVADPLNMLVLRRSLRALHGVVKEFSTMKLPSQIKVMEEMENTLFRPFMDLWIQYSLSFRALLDPSNLANPVLAHDLDIAHLAFKSYSKLFAWRWNRSAKQNTGWEDKLTEAMRISVEQFQVLCNMRMQLISALNQTDPPLLSGPNGTICNDPAMAATLTLLTRHVMVFGKVFRRLCQLKRDAFVSHLSTPHLITFYWNLVTNATQLPTVIDSPFALYPLRLLVQALFLFREFMQDWSLLARRHKVENLQELLASPDSPVSPDLREILGAGNVLRSIDLLITQLIPLRPEDLHKWESEPEEWFVAQEGESEQWEYELRGSAERVLMIFVSNFADVAKPELLRMYQQVAGNHSVDLQAILHKESVYCAINRSIHQMKENLNFDEMLGNHFVADVQVEDAAYSVVKRGIAVIIGKWVYEEAVPAPTELVWQILLRLLQDQSSSIIVRLSAAGAIRQCIDTVGFNKDVFAPYLRDILAGLVNLFNECENMESKRFATKALAFVIECADDLVMNYAKELCDTIPSMWASADAEQNSLLKADLITIATKLVGATKSNSMYLWPIVIPLVQMGFQGGVAAQLDEDALDLWIHALRWTESLTDAQGSSPNLMELLPLLQNLLLNNLDLLGRVLHVVDGYLLIDAPRVLHANSNGLVEGFNKVFKTAIQTNVRDLVASVQIMIRSSPPDLWAGPLHTTGFFWNILEDFLASKAKAAILNQYLFFIARLTLVNTKAFMMLMEAAANEHHMSLEQLYNDLLQQWWEKFDAVAEPNNRKLLVMGTACLVATAQPVVLKRLSGDIFDMWLSVLGELEEAWKNDELDAQHPLYIREDSSEWACVDLPLESEGTLEQGRREQLNATDPVTTERLGPFIKHQLDIAAQVCPGGPSEFQNTYIAGANPLVTNQLYKYLGIIG